MTTGQVGAAARRASVGISGPVDGPARNDEVLGGLSSAPANGQEKPPLGFPAKPQGTLSTGRQPLAPLKRIGHDVTVHVTGFLTLIDAVRLMWADPRLKPVVEKALPYLALLRQQLAFCEEEIRQIPALRALEATLAAEAKTLNAQLTRAEDRLAFPGMLPGEPFAGLVCLLYYVRREREYERALAAVDQKLLASSPIKEQLAQQEAELGRHMAEIRNVVFHVGELRASGQRPEARGPQPLDHAVLSGRYAEVLNDIYDGKVSIEQVRASLREYVNMPRLLVSSEAIQGGVLAIRNIVERAHAQLEGPERGVYDAIRMAVGEIAGTTSLNKDEIMALCVTPEGVSLAGSALHYRNPVVAACIIIAIQRSNADPDLKKQLLEGLASGFKDVPDLLNKVSTELAKVKSDIPESADWLSERCTEIRRVRDEAAQKPLLGKSGP